MEVQEHISLKPYNSFGLNAKARFYSKVKDLKDLKEALTSKVHPTLFVLSGGSNILLTKDLDAHVIHICNKGIAVVSQTNTHITLEVAAGENWHELVMWAVAKGFGGIENLALIPGCAGSAPIQNIGAYGVELKDTFISCKALEIATLETHTITKNACEFGYRSSVFKTKAKGKYIIYSITLRLTKAPHTLHTQYGDIKVTLEANTPKYKKKAIGLKEVANAVMAIRASKLPDPKVLGNSGSFFKNPVLDQKAYLNFITVCPEAPSYPMKGNKHKIPAGWLIEQVGLKGYREKAVGVHHKQALVLVNYGGAKGSDVLALAQKVRDKVFKMFKIKLETEVNIIAF